MQSNSEHSDGDACKKMPTNKIVLISIFLVIFLFTHVRMYSTKVYKKKKQIIRYDKIRYDSKKRLKK